MPHAQPSLEPTAGAGPGGGCSVTHLFPRLWLFLCLGTGGVGRLPATDASGQVGRRLNLAELEPAEGPANRAERVTVGAGLGRLREDGPRSGKAPGPAVICRARFTAASWLSTHETLTPHWQDNKHLTC